MPYAEGVIRAFVHLREAADAFARAVLPESLPAPGEYLVGVCLVADVEDYLVLWSIK